MIVLFSSKHCKKGLFLRMEGDEDGQAQDAYARSGRGELQ